MSGRDKKKESSPPVSNAKVLFLRLFRYAWQHRTVFLISILAAGVFALSNTAFLGLIKELANEGFVNKNQARITILPFMLFGIIAVRGLSTFVSNYSIRWVARRVVEAMRTQAFAKLMQLPMHFYDNQSVGLLVSKLTYDVERLAVLCGRVSINIIRDIFTLIGLLAYLLWLDWKLTLIFLTVAPLMTMYLRKQTPKLRQNAKRVQAMVGEMTKVAEEALAGQRIVKIFGAQDYENTRFSKVVSKNRELELKTARISGLNSFVVELLTAFALGLVVFYALKVFNIGEFAAFLTALLMLMAPIKHLSAANEDFQVGLAAAQSVFDVMDSTPEINEGSKTIDRAKGDLTFKHISIRYDNAKKPALDDLSFSVSAGEKVALVGKSGGGKTTLVNLLPRFYEMQQGTILLDGTDIRALELANLRAQFSLVSQDIVLFNDTVFNNIAYGSMQSATEQEVIAAAKAAHAWEFIQQMPEGLQSEIGDRGVRLSGGQRQRLAIARAILKNAPILLLDEATSALDSESEMHVQAALDHMMQNRTTLVIAHRLSTIENADRILVMDQGKIVESGAHAQLLAQNGYYRKLYQKEFAD